METMRTSTGVGSETVWAAPAPPPQAAWYSPVPYVFGGLAAMVCLFSVAILLLACSYWKLFQRLDGGGGGSGNTNLEAEPSAASDGDDVAKPLSTVSERVVVIMAGDEKPTFIGVAFGDGGENNRQKGDEMNSGEMGSKMV